MGIYDGVGVHGTSDDASIGSRRLARLHPHARPGRRGALRPGPGRRPDLHRLARLAVQIDGDPGVAAVDLLGGTSCQPCCSREAWWSEWRMQRVPMNTPRVCLRITAYHSVLASRSPRTGCQGRGGRSSGAVDAGRDELVQGGDLTRGGVDEERAHAHPGYGGGLRALARRPADLRRRPAAPRRRRPHPPAYGTDAAELAAWATANGLDPDRGRLQGRCAAGPRGSRQQGAAPRTMARKLASIRSLFRSLLEHGEVAANPADLLPAPEAAADACRRRSSPHDVARLLEQIPAAHAARAARSRPVRARLLAAACGPRSSSISTSPASTSTQEQVRVEGKGAKTRFVPAGEPALRSRSRPIWSARGPALPAPSPRPGAVPVQERQAALDVATSAAACGCGRATPPRRPACTRTRSGIPSPPTCWRAARTCGRSRRCSVTRASRRPRSTLG